MVTYESECPYRTSQRQAEDKEQRSIQWARDVNGGGECTQRVQEKNARQWRPVMKLDEKVLRRVCPAGYPEDDDEANAMMGLVRHEVLSGAFCPVNGQSTPQDCGIKCPCSESSCMCLNYARHPLHGKVGSELCYDELCSIHALSKVKRGIEPRPSKGLKRPTWES